MLDTETTGIRARMFVVELAARRMRGWRPEGPPIRRLLNQSAAIPPESARVHGHTREILERNGEPAEAVYADFAAYAEDRPLVSYHLAYDLEEVLQPEWARLGLFSPIGRRGFCALRLYHPDRYRADPRKQAIFERLTQAINQARDAGDSARLREIAENPEAFLPKQGWGELDFGEAADLMQWRRLFESLQQSILALLEALNELHEDPGYDLHLRCAEWPEHLAELAAEMVHTIAGEIAELETEAALAAEIVTLTGEPAAGEWLRD